MFPKLGFVFMQNTCIDPVGKRRSSCSSHELGFVFIENTVWVL